MGLPIASASLSCLLTLKVRIKLIGRCVALRPVVDLITRCMFKMQCELPTIFGAPQDGHRPNAQPMLCRSSHSARMRLKGRGHRLRGGLGDTRQETSLCAPEFVMSGENVRHPLFVSLCASIYSWEWTRSVVYCARHSC